MPTGILEMEDAKPQMINAWWMQLTISAGTNADLTKPKEFIN